MPKNLLGHPVQWLWTMKKLNTPFSVSSYPIGVELGRKAFGYPLTLTATWYDRGDIYFDEEEIELIRTFLRVKIAEDPAYPDRMARSIIKLAKAIRRQPENVPKRRRASLSVLLKLFQTRVRPFLEMIGFMSYRGSIQMGDILADEVASVLTYRLAERRKLRSLGRYRGRLSAPALPSVIGEEQQYSLTVATTFRRLSTTAQGRRIADYRKRFGWMDYHWLVGTPKTDDAIRARWLKLAPTAKSKLGRLGRENEEKERTVRRVIRELKLTARERLLVRQYRIWLSLRTYVKDHINLAGYKLLPVLDRIAEAVGAPRGQLPYLTIDEVRNIRKLTRSKIIREIEQRRRGFSAGIVDGAFAFRPFAGAGKSAQAAECAEERIMIVRGSTAFPGVVKGRVRIVHSPKDQHELKRGDVLVTAMTTPDLLPAMERAAAFVTDEGGITSHAAIIAREMKKPCIIGTKIATRVLKDGDRVEVDATRGIVKKL